MEWIDEVLSDPENEKVLYGVKASVNNFMKSFPLYEEVETPVGVEG